jgi:hypothetical protein
VPASPTEIKRRLDTEVEKIRGYADLTDEAKRRRIAEAYEKAEAEHREAVEAQERQVRERVEKAEKTVFATPYPYGASVVEQAQIRAARRAAYNDVYSAIAFSEDPGYTDTELERLLERAERTQDPELAAAVYHVATERGARKVADSYLEKRPAEKRRWEEYVTARQEADSLERVFERAMTGGALQKPAELEGLPQATGTAR